jgi:hypothetical protein
MLPLPQVTELEDLPPEFSAERLWPGLGGHRLLPGGQPLDLTLLQRFKGLMALEQWPVQLARMCYDRLYAYERIAQAHASADDGLRAVALQLFQIYHRIDQVEGDGRLHS